MSEVVSVYIEIEQNSNIKYEYDKTLKKLVVDRILEDPFFYPYSYGFIPNTLAGDNDELDILIITNNKILIDNYYDVYIIGGLMMTDEKGDDEKILCVLKEDYEKINDISNLEEETKNKISYFFENYKKNTPDKWSLINGFIDKKSSMKIYHESINRFKKNQ